MITDPPAIHPPEPPTTTVWRHMKNWKSVYFLAPIAFFLIWLFAKLAYLITGYRPTANGDWIPEAAGNAVKFEIGRAHV